MPCTAGAYIQPNRRRERGRGEAEGAGTVG